MYMHIQIYCDVPGWPCLSEKRANQMCGSSTCGRTKGSLAPRVLSLPGRFVGMRQYLFVRVSSWIKLYYIKSVPSTTWGQLQIYGVFCIEWMLFMYYRWMKVNLMFLQICILFALINGMCRVMLVSIYPDMLYITTCLYINKGYILAWWMWSK